MSIHDHVLCLLSYTQQLFFYYSLKNFNEPKPKKEEKKNQNKIKL